MKCVLCEFNKYDNCDYSRKKYITCISGLFIHSATIANVILIQIHREHLIVLSFYCYIWYLINQNDAVCKSPYITKYRSFIFSKMLSYKQTYFLDCFHCFFKFNIVTHTLSVPLVFIINIIYGSQRNILRQEFLLEIWQWFVQQIHRLKRNDACTQMTYWKVSLNC